MVIKVEIKGLAGVVKNLSAVQKQVRFATAVALTRTAKDVEKAMIGEFKAKFDAPTPTALRGFRTKTATRENLTAEVLLKDRPLGGKNLNSISQILGHHFSGGGRIKKQLEVILEQNNFISASEYVVPGQAARLDRYGNISRGQIVQILSQIGIKRLGFDSNPTNSARSRRNVAMAGVIFWSYGPNSSRRRLVDPSSGIEYGYQGGAASRLPKGAWIRNGRSVRPILLAVRRPNYRKRFDLNLTADGVVNKKFDGHFNAALAVALRTSR